MKNFNKVKAVLKTKLSFKFYQIYQKRRSLEQTD